MSISSKNSVEDLDEMDLHNMEQLMLDGGLTILSAANITQRAQLITQLKTTDHRRFTKRLEENGGQAFASTTQSGKKCNFSVPVHKLSALIPKEDKPGENKRVGPSYYLNVLQQAEWSKDNLTSTVYIPTSGETMTLASEMHRYAVTDYHKFVSQKVLDDNSFREAFMAQYGAGNPDLTIDMIITHTF